MKRILLCLMMATLMTLSAEAQTDKVYDRVEVMPEFPGGMQGLFEYMQNNVNYLIFYCYHHKKMKQYGKVLSHIEELQKQLTEQEKAHPLPKEWNLKEAIHENNSIHRFHRLADKGKEPQLEDWTELSEITEQYVPGFSRFIHQNGVLSERDTHICMLIKMRFHPSEIAVLIGASPQTVTNSRVRLLRKIFGEQGGAKDFDEHIREME